MTAWLALEDGTVFRGMSAGAEGVAIGEVVFNTSLTGYQEVLTDPSYAGQIVTMTCPEIGNYGVVAEDSESDRPKVAGFIVRQQSRIASNWRATGTLADYLAANGVVAISGIDTRALTRRLRSGGVLRGVLATGDVDPARLVRMAGEAPSMEGADLVRAVTCAQPYDFDPLSWSPSNFALAPPHDADGAPPGSPLPGGQPAGRVAGPFRVAAYDFGIKRNILRRLAAYGCQVRVFPANAPPRELLEFEPDGVFLSNGPGDPAAVRYAIEGVREILADADLPVFGICLGHQILALAFGAQTFKLKFGHRGGNHPVKRLRNGRVEITAQNHGFAVDPASLPPDLEITHLNLYDGTVEGLEHKSRPLFSVQYHPEASPGPHDADYLFRRFTQAMACRW
ncbi:MAG: glutamine-hydrolyzing carbamoyl-phosphate synthase small subunit [Vicinamibacterales bacterium]